jgi:hypothetical protein
MCSEREKTEDFMEIRKNSTGQFVVKGSETFDLRGMLKKYGFIYKPENHWWEGTEDMVDILKKYISNFKSNIQIVTFIEK